MAYVAVERGQREAVKFPGAAQHADSPGRTSGRCGYSRAATTLEVAADRILNIVNRVGP
jgi:hypothetical protein